MEPRILCDDGIVIQLVGEDNRALVTFHGNGAARFWCDTVDLLTVLEGAPLQLASFEGYCKFSKHGDAVDLEFKLTDHPKGKCSIPLKEFSEALREINP